MDGSHPEDPVTDGPDDGRGEGWGGGGSGDRPRPVVRKSCGCVRTCWHRYSTDPRD